MTASRSESFSYDPMANAKTKAAGDTTRACASEARDALECDGNGMRMRSKLAGAANWTNFVYDELTWELLSEYTLISGAFTIKSLNTYGIGLISAERVGVKR